MDVRKNSIYWICYQVHNYSAYNLMWYIFRIKMIEIKKLCYTVWIQSEYRYCKVKWKERQRELEGVKEIVLMGTVNSVYFNLNNISFILHARIWLSWTLSLVCKWKLGVRITLSILDGLYIGYNRATVYCYFYYLNYRFTL